MPSKTRFPELSYTNDGPDFWRFCASEDGVEVGQIYKTKAALLADLERYAAEYGCEGTEPSKEDYLREALEEIASRAGQTLLGNGRYDEGANRAFEECAALAKHALDKAKGH